MESRALRPISKAVVAAGTAGAIATACWLLNRILDDDELQCTEVTPSSYLNLMASTTFDDYNQTANTQQQQEENDTDKSFALLPIVSESDDEIDEDAMDYTADYFTPLHDVCIVSVNVETVDVPVNDLSECRLCRTAVKSYDSIDDGMQLDKKPRTLSFSNTETSSNDSLLSLSSECVEDEEIQGLQTCSKSQQWLYVRL
ncbi:unnamed protein product [Peronospora farinosa]|uniref:Transmembrane protein n=1 Tax=Peronospora farinosa TaxID=134698 RepID=A0AAV0TLK3_9STRA|nr:unnamed protein product [Peronospora farinosa]CAI5722352.1 unnamed protein product [Peronospora farinosa]